MTAHYHHTKRTLSLLALSVFLSAGCDSGEIDPPMPTIQGVVADGEGHAYPHVTVTLRRAGSAAELRRETTDAEGKFSFTIIGADDYEVAIELRASEVVGANPAAVTVDEGTTAQADFTVRPLPIEGIVAEEDIRNASGEKPENPDEPLYHANDPDELPPILAPDGHHVTLSEWRQVGGTARVTCNGSSGTRYALTLDGLIPNGVYTVQAVLINFNDPDPIVRVGEGKLGPVAGDSNVFTASVSGEGLLEVTAPPGPMSLSGSAPECLLTQVDSGTLWVIYQLDGQPVQGAPGPNRAAWVEHMSISI